MIQSKNISVIIPAYNSSSFIREAIDSVLNQSITPSEIIVVDDASCDTTCDIIKEYEGRVRLLKNDQNCGPGESRNRGVSVANGELIAFLDADDFWEIKHLEVLSNLLGENHEVDIAFGRTLTCGYKTTPTIWPPVLIDAGVPLNLLDLLMQRNVVRPSTVMLRKHLVTVVGGFHDTNVFWDGRRIQLEDHDYFLRCALSAKFIMSPQITVHYRQHAMQAATVRTAMLLISTFSYRLSFIENLIQKGWDHVEIERYQNILKTQWEDALNHAWNKYSLQNVHLMLDYGNKTLLFKDITQNYILKWRVIRIDKDADGSLFRTWLWKFQNRFSLVRFMCNKIGALLNRHVVIPCEGK